MGCLAAADDDMPRGRPFVDVELREHFPAASSSQDTYTLLKFYNLSKDLVKTVLRVSLLHNILHICTLLHTVLLLLPNQHIIRMQKLKATQRTQHVRRCRELQLLVLRVTMFCCTVLMAQPIELADIMCILARHAFCI